MMPAHMFRKAGVGIEWNANAVSSAMEFQRVELRRFKSCMDEFVRIERRAKVDVY